MKRIKDEIRAEGINVLEFEAKLPSCIGSKVKELSQQMQPISRLVYAETSDEIQELANEIGALEVKRLFSILAKDFKPHVLKLCPNIEQLQSKGEPNREELTQLP